MNDVYISCWFLVYIQHTASKKYPKCVPEMKGKICLLIGWAQVIGTRDYKSAFSYTSLSDEHVLKLHANSSIETIACVTILVIKSITV